MSTRQLQSRTLSFGRRQPFVTDVIEAPAPSINDDFRLFALTYAAGFLAVSIFLA